MEAPVPAAHFYGCVGSGWAVAWAHNGLVWAPGATTQCPHGPNWPTRAGMQQVAAIGCPIGGLGLALGVPNPPPVAKFTSPHSL